MISEFITVLDAVTRVPFWFLLDFIVSNRFVPMYERLSERPSWVSFMCPDCSSWFVKSNLPLVMFLCCLLCIVAVSFHRVALWIIYLCIFGAASTLTAISIYLLILHFAYTPWDRVELDPFVEIYLSCAFLIGFNALIVPAVMSLPNRLPVKNCLIISLVALFIPLISFAPVQFLRSTGPVTYSCAGPNLNLTSSECFTPAWHAYAVSLLKLRHCLVNNVIPFDVCTVVDSRYASLYKNRVCPATPSFRYLGFYCTSSVRDIVLWFSSYLLPSLYGLLFFLCVHLTSMVGRVVASFRMEYEHYRIAGLFGYINFHWHRLNVAVTLALFWILKISLVISMGPEYWPIQPDRPQDNVTELFTVNISFLHEFTQPSDPRSTVSILLTRIYVAALVHGSETWLAVFGAAAFFAACAVIIVQLLVKLVDPTGEETNRLDAAAGEVPVDIQEWNVIDDPALALDQNDVIAAEMLSGTGWNCAVVFLFLALQYDLPSLPLAQRICCSIYGIIVIGITCIHPVQALIKSLLLRLENPGHGSSWMAHLRPLLFCAGLIISSVCIIFYVPDGLAERVSKQMEQNGTTNSTSPILVPRFGSSVESLRARQLRIVLCGLQLLLALLVTLVEYVIYQISRLYPDWSGFRRALFWTKLVSSVIDYLISLLSFLTVCWLSIYDSIGLCRLLIICCYFYFILYPSAVRAYTWIRWRFSFRKRMNSLLAPTEQELITLGDTCPICYSEMTTTNAKVTRCGHLYHTDCLANWMRRQLFCPICHADLLSNKVVNRRQPTNQGD